MKKLLDTLLEKYDDVLNDLGIGYPLKESTISELWELIHVIDCLRFGELSNQEINKILRHYE